MIPWELSRRNPMIDVRMVATRQFGAWFMVMLATGAILLATTQFLPQLVQQNFGYTATWAGLVLIARRPCDHGHDAAGRPSDRQSAAALPDRRRGRDLRLCDVRHDQRHTAISASGSSPRSRMLSRHRTAADLPSDHRRVL